MVLEKRVTLILACFVLSGLLFGPETFGYGKWAAPVTAKKDKKGKKKTGAKDKQLSKQHYTQATNLFKKGMYEEAAEYFIKADNASPTPMALYYAGVCFENLYDYEQAYEYYARYLESGDETKKDEVKETLEKLEEMTVILKVVSTPEGAEVYIDGEKVKFQKTPVIAEVKPGKHTVMIRLEGYETVKQAIEIQIGGEERLDITLVKTGEVPEPPIEEEEEEAVEEVPAEEEEEEAEEEESVEITEEVKPSKRAVLVSIGFAAGATVSTTDRLGSFIDATLGLAFGIKQGRVGINIDNMIFVDSYLLAAYPTGGYTLKLPKNLSLNFTAGFGFAYLHAFKDGGDGKGNVVVESGNHWDLVAHGDLKILYKAGPIMIQAVPLHADILVGLGTIDPAPLAQFAFLVGIAYDF